MTRFLCCGVLLSACTVLNVEVKGRTEQLVGDEVAEYQKMKRWVPEPVDQRCHYWNALVDEVTGPTPTSIAGVTTSRSPRMQAVVADERDRACTAP